MLERVEVHGWQSLRSLDLALGRFTVIVGPSSSGKSALMRAIRAVACNVRGGQSITRGCAKAAVTLYTAEHVVTLERSATSGCYRVVDRASGLEQVYTKLGGQVPDEVTRALRIQPVAPGAVSINFAGQFDRPFLLDESGATAARILGELTNVSTIFNAVREANRRRNTYAATLRTREDDIASVRQRLGAFTGIVNRARVVASCEQLAARAGQLVGHIESLGQALETLERAEHLLEHRAAVLTVPTLDEVLQLATRVKDLNAILDDLQRFDQTAAQAHTQADRAGCERDELTSKVQEALASAGYCPTCLRPAA